MSFAEWLQRNELETVAGKRVEQAETGDPFPEASQ